MATSGNPIIIAAAVSDVVVNTTDAIVQGFDKDIMALDGGTEFLQEWNTVYYSANLASAVIALPELFANGMKLIQLARTTGMTKAINFIKACLVKIILEKILLLLQVIR
ncbi:hypothetical protein [Chryseobacterium carnipullorum]|uniref:Uncharacterized protein n=1 Tax=Chryseobacterium carnipullorum TaxID=1124835 RepID=A0A376EMA6_CHRCU|nr:hypothetical protein [Chryseobacterium carnipullorum]STD11608.1 Uncharacterised protein [Chryseobacterium carnipullorum]